MADKDVDVTITEILVDPGPNQYDWSIEDPIDMETGRKNLVFKSAGSNKSAWSFTNVSIWKSGDPEPTQPGSVVAPFGTPSVQNNKITIDDNDTAAGTYEYRLYADYGGTSISHDPQIINRGA